MKFEDYGKERKKKDLNQENGEEYQYGDRRQELVFIGMDLKHTTIQNTLDMCLLDDDEMELGPEGWLQTMESEDNIKLSWNLDNDDDEDYEDDEEEESN